MGLPMRNNPLGLQIRDRYPSFLVARVEMVIVGRKRAAVDRVGVRSEDVGWRGRHGVFGDVTCNECRKLLRVEGVGRGDEGWLMMC